MEATNSSFLFPNYSNFFSSTTFGSTLPTSPAPDIAERCGTHCQWMYVIGLASLIVSMIGLLTCIKKVCERSDRPSGDPSAPPATQPTTVVSKGPVFYNSGPGSMCIHGAQDPARCGGVQSNIQLAPSISPHPWQDPMDETWV